MMGLLEVARYLEPRLQRFAGMREIVMAKVIEFYVPTNFRTPLKGTSRRCGKVIEFCTQTKSA